MEEKAYLMKKLRGDIVNIKDFNQCKECHSGKYVIKESKYKDAVFAGCNNFPNCRSTITIAEYVKEYLKNNGLNIYCWKKQCPKCKSETRVISYFLNYELAEYDEWFQHGWMIGLGDIPFIDKILMNKYDNIKIMKSKTTNSTNISNVCEHCGCLQGRNYVVDDPHEIMNDLLFERSMDKYLIDNIKFDDVFIPYAELNNLFN